MKKRILKILCKLYRDTWKKVIAWPLNRDGHSNEWNYYTWAGMTIHHNIETDKIVCYCDGKRWAEKGVPLSRWEKVGGGT